MAKRGRTIPLGEWGLWWRRLARGAIDNDPRPLRILGVDLARHLPEKGKFDHAHLSKFASGAIDQRTGEPFDPTLDLIQALCEEFRLPPPVHFARSYNESVEQMRIAEKYDAVPVAHVATDNDLTPLPKPDKRRKRPTHVTATAHPIAKRKTRSA
jgi:hypothetical protein